MLATYIAMHSLAIATVNIAQLQILTMLGESYTYIHSQQYQLQQHIANCKERFALHVCLPVATAITALKYMNSSYIATFKNYQHCEICKVIATVSCTTYHIVHLGHFLVHQVGLIHKLNYLDVTQISNVVQKTVLVFGK